MEEKDHLNVAPDAQKRLHALRALPKFTSDASRVIPYMGYLPPEKRPEAEQQVNSLIDRIASGIEANPNKKFVLKEFRLTFDYFEKSDTEDRERFCEYLENIMDAIGMESSDGAINEWMYGI